MNVIVDTCVWSLALRRSPIADTPIIAELARLISAGRVVLLGVVRQELLSGVKGARQFDSLRTHLRAFSDFEVDTDDHETAARFCNRCRSRGVQGGAVDFLICAIAAKHNLAIMTVDRDFERYATVLGLTLHQPTT